MIELKNSENISEKAVQELNDIYKKALKSRPVIIYFHGTAGNRASPNRVHTHKRLASDLEMNVIAVDYRGYGDSSGWPSENGLAKDARATWDWVIDQGVSKQNIIIMGHSLGTGPAARLAHDLDKEEIRPRALILQAAYSSISSVLFEYQMFEYIPIFAPLKLFPGLHEYLTSSLIDKYDTASKLSEIHCPILIIYGARDKEIPPRHSHILFEEATKYMSRANEIPTSPKIEESLQIVSDDNRWSWAEETRDREGRKWLANCNNQSQQQFEDFDHISGRTRTARNLKRQITGRGPNIVCLVEISKATHYTGQAFDLSYKSIRQIIEIGNYE
ncbi:hypothetical protein HK096_003508 [Nowakowskiella sp. JEL0078]|nr:hypothetical protein HK096_003508 [Nowakowskiella sp. JEL0078]